MGSVARGALCCFAIVIGTAKAFAEGSPSGVRLEFTRTRGADGCPDEQGFRDEVASQMAGIDPFTADGAARMEVTITHRARDFQGVIQLHNSGGEANGRRELMAATCGALVQDIATAISIALQPLRSSSTPPPLPPSATSTARPPPPPSRDRAPPAPASQPSLHRPLLRFGAGGVLSGGFSPSLAGGFEGLVGLRWPAWSLALGGRGDLPISATVGEGMMVRASFLGGTVAGCYHKNIFLGGGVIAAGRVLEALGAKAMPETQSSAYLATGPRIGIEVKFSSHLAGQLTGDLLVPIIRPGIRYGGRVLWQGPWLSEVLGLRLVAFF